MPDRELTLRELDFELDEGEALWQRWFLELERRVQAGQTPEALPCGSADDYMLLNWCASDAATWLLGGSADKHKIASWCSLRLLHSVSFCVPHHLQSAHPSFSLSAAIGQTAWARHDITQVQASEAADVDGLVRVLDQRRPDGNCQLAAVQGLCACVIAIGQPGWLRRAAMLAVQLAMQAKWPLRVQELGIRWHSLD